MTTDRATVQQIAEQIGSTLLDDNAQWTNRFQVKSRTSDSLYVIAQQRTDGVWGCSCPGWRHHRKCKHLTDVLGRLNKIADQYKHLAFMVSARTAYLILDEPTTKVTVKKPAPTKGRVLDLD